ncbi:MAG: hypothetical protein KIS76_03850 [Pyrinomonadaceae bacterium]|nr:hypothetical protein [Pyrinomonadaceae bacterium]
MARVDVDKSALLELGSEIERAKRELLGRLAEYGYRALREEVPVATGNLKQGVAPPDVNYSRMSAVLTVSAKSGRTGKRTARLIGADGREKKTVSLRPQKARNYAEDVALGRPSIKPKRAKTLIIPVAETPKGESYLIADGQMFVFRRSAAAVKANRYDLRAAERVEQKAVSIAEDVLRRIFE